MIRSAAIAMIKWYQTWLSPLKIFFGVSGGSCRFTPTCSEYAIGAIHSHGVFKGFFLGIYRIMRCQPWGGQGYDPVPPASPKKQGTERVCGCGSASQHLEQFHG